jgi:allantoin racemase
MTIRIAVINPNTTASMTATIAAAATRAVAPGTVIVPVTNTTGAASIESHLDEALAVPGMVDAIRRLEGDGVDGYVLACFGDPGLDAAREVAAGPVVGIAEAAMHYATLLGRSFSIVTTLARTVGQAEHLVERYGFERKCRSIYACDVPVLELDDPASDARRLVVDFCRRAVEVDHADSVVLGCAGMADFAAEATAEVGVPVIDGVGAGAALVEGLVRLGLQTSTRSEYAAPPDKPRR